MPAQSYPLNGPRSPTLERRGVRRVYEGNVIALHHLDEDISMPLL